MPTRSVKWYGWVPDLPDHRDLLYAAPLTRAPLAAKIDLRTQFPVDCYDQGELGSCTGNAIAAAVQFARMKAGRTPDFIPSRLFIYFNERDMEGSVGEDSGAQIRDGIKSVASLGAPPEPDWPYVIAKFASKPPLRAYRDAVHDRAVAYQRIVQDLSQMKGCLASGYPFVFGFTVYQSFVAPTVARTGHAPMPGWGERPIGGHAVMAVGYDDANQWFLVRNSWGKGWGMNGYFTLPYPYLIQGGLAADFWTIRLVG